VTSLGCAARESGQNRTGTPKSDPGGGAANAKPIRTPQQEKYDQCDSSDLRFSFAMTLGSILSFIVMSVTVGSSRDAALVYHQRMFASAISRLVSVPGWSCSWRYRSSSSSLQMERMDGER
jgi:hypothetical protein